MARVSLLSWRMCGNRSLKLAIQGHNDNLNRGNPLWDLEDVEMKKSLVLQYRHLLGKVIDDIIALKCGCHRGKVAEIRKSLKIPAYRKHMRVWFPKISRENFNLNIFPLLGKTTDAEIGRKFKVSREMVRQWRGKYGIKKFNTGCL